MREYLSGNELASILKESNQPNCLAQADYVAFARLSRHPITVMTVPACWDDGLDRDFDGGDNSRLRSA